MSLRQRHDSSRDLLEELEDGWGNPPPPAAGMPLPGAPQNNGTKQAAIAKDSASTDVAAIAKGGGSTVVAAIAEATEVATDDVPTLAESNPDLASLDEGWLDELFPGEQDDEEEEEDDEPEPELPDERLDPEAFALAKKARDERAARKKEKKRQKAEAKRARQKARADAIRQKQKAKKARAGAASRRAPEPPSKKKNERSKANAPKPRAAEAAAERAEDAADLAAAGVPVSKSRAKVSEAPRHPRSTLASVKLLAIVLATLLALAAAVAAIMK